MGSSANTGHPDDGASGQPRLHQVTIDALAQLGDALAVAGSC
jgi:hypothetical protein